MILIINCIAENQIAMTFNTTLWQIYKKIGANVDFCRISKGETVPGLKHYSHVIISGAEASVCDENSWDTVLENIIKDSVSLRKPLLGICYGHQFIGRVLGGKGNVRKSKTPEFGWQNIKLNGGERTLFKDVHEPVCMVSHFDEVFDLPPDFSILASSDKCGVHAFQYKDYPIYGVQFHPEYDVNGANEIFDVVLKNNPEISNHMIKPLDDSYVNRIEQNRRIFANFFQLQL